MEIFFVNLRIGKKRRMVPAIKIGNMVIISVGKSIKKALIYQEDWHEFYLDESIEDLIEKIKKSDLKVDLFIFGQKIPKTRPRFKYHFEWDNIAAIPIITYQDWISSLSSDARKDLKRAERMGVLTKMVTFSDDLVQGIMEIHNESPIRQGKYFVHYGKDFATVKKEYSTYPERSEFIAAYYKDELIGLIKIVYVGEIACIMEIISKKSHYNKRTTNALIAKAVEACVINKKSYLTYGKYHYGKKKDSLVDFKYRMGFKKILYPRYFIPLTYKGKIAIWLKLHRPLLDIVPGILMTLYIKLRAVIIKIRYSHIFIEKKEHT